MIVFLALAITFMCRVGKESVSAPRFFTLSDASGMKPIGAKTHAKDGIITVNRSISTNLKI